LPIGVGQTMRGIEEVRVQRGRETVTVPGGELRAALSAHPRALVDVGTGDGRFVLRTARERPDWLVAGVDPVADAMREASWRAGRKPPRGGAANAWFLVHALEALPAALAGAADEVTVNFPWGTLLEAVTTPRAEGLAALRELLKPGGELAVTLNRTAQLDQAYAGRLGVPVLDDAHLGDALPRAYRRAGLLAIPEGAARDGGDPGSGASGRTSWGRRLVEGSGREVAVVRFRREG
jgi:16S rRNA (adenine(1408)-N(1))-methyltransferase